MCTYLFFFQIFNDLYITVAALLPRPLAKKYNEKSLGILYLYIDRREKTNHFKYKRTMNNVKNQNRHTNTKRKRITNFNTY